MAHLHRHTGKEVHLLSGPSELQPVNDCNTIHTQGEGPGPTPTAKCLRSSKAQRPSTDTMTDKTQLHPVDRE